MTKISIDVGDRSSGLCVESHTFYADNKCPLLRGGGMSVWWCEYFGECHWLKENERRLPIRECAALEAQG